MADLPYPGYPPNYTSVITTGGLARTCLVVECLSFASLTVTELAILQESLEAALAQVHRRLPTLETVKVVRPTQFDTLLRRGLRLP